MTRPSRLALVQGAFALFGCAILGRAAWVQLWQGDAWRARAERQHAAVTELPARRGAIFDATGAVLAESRDLVRLSIAPKEIRRRTAIERGLARAGVPASWMREHLRGDRAWVTVPGTFLPADVAPLVSQRGVHVEPASVRDYARSSGARKLVGRVGRDGRALDGLELALDSLLSGRAGTTRVLKDARGRRFESPTTPGTPPVPGHSVVLTINHELQSIADRALADAVASLDAAGGDIVVMRPGTGELLAIASVRRGRRDGGVVTALTEPFEPGSTAKPFAAAALLAHRRARPSDVVDTHEGALTLYGRTITDEHPRPRMTLTEVIAYSSNVGIARLAARLSPREQYEMLRDFGFGAPTGVPYPSEASGTLREPKAWSKQSAASLSIGYEMAVTPVQLATAYAAIANGGELLEPALIREVRTPEGEVLYRHQRRVVRRVLEPAVAAELRRMLASVVAAEGTGSEAELSQFVVAGKTGTARRVRVGGSGYAPNEYTASFVGLFPADEPQYVILVKIDSPRGGSIFGGKVAAPISRQVLQAALAARDASLDRGKLSAGARNSVAADDVAIEDDTTAVGGAVPYIVSLETPEQRRATPLKSRTPRAVPDVRGAPLREAVHRLHRAGFRVELARGASPGTMPAPGTLAPAGSVVKVTWSGGAQ